MHNDSELLADLLRVWGRWYVIFCVSGLYTAERRDNGARTSQADPEQLGAEIAADYAACPVRVPAGTRYSRLNQF